MKNRFKHCFSKNEAWQLLRLLLLSDVTESEQQLINDEYSAYLAFEKRYEGVSYRPATMDDEQGYDYLENIDYKDIPDYIDDYPTDDPI